MPCDTEYRGLDAHITSRMQTKSLHYKEISEYYIADNAFSVSELQNITGTIGEQQILTLRTVLAFLPTNVDEVDGLLTQLIETNRDPYLAHRIKPAVQAFRVGNSTAAQYWLERAVGYLQTRLVHR